MDVLNPDEINAINRASVLVPKYSQVFDRESAYEILGRKIDSLRKEKEEEAARMAREKARSGSMARTTTRRTSGTTKSRRTTTSPVVKVLTSATFIRGVLGILKKVI
jgi:hypothetical protein